MFGCTLDYDPIITFDHVSDTLLLDFTEDLGFFVFLDLVKGKVSKSLNTKDAFFMGFENMAYSPKYLQDRILGAFLFDGDDIRCTLTSYARFEWHRDPKRVL